VKPKTVAEKGKALVLWFDEVVRPLRVSTSFPQRERRRERREKRKRRKRRRGGGGGGEGEGTHIYLYS